MLSSSLHGRAKELFLTAVSLPVDERDAFLKENCGGDEELLREAASLLAFHAEDAGEPEDPSFMAGDVLAERYRMIARIGRGGMGDVWRADDLVLDTPVALKLIRTASPDARARILQEVRLARLITHRSICRVFDVGEAGDVVFFSMELVRGEDLAALIRRVGRLPSERVLEIAHELCAGLAAAHAQGVLHRDLKPANVLIDHDGLVRITDFGIAIPSREAGHHTMVGTPGYMAPEQVESGATLSDQTDIYSLGVVLYELVTGERYAKPSGDRSPRPSEIVPDVDKRLERAVLRAVSANPSDRPPSAVAMAAALPPLDKNGTTTSAVQHLFGRYWALGAAAIVLLLLGVAASPWFLSARADPLSAQDTIVLADFVNATGDPVFDGTLKVALAVALEQSPFLKVFPDDRVHEDLRLMEQPADAPFTRALAREVAQREQLKALIAGSIASLGRNYVIALEAVNAATGDIVAREQVEATDKEMVLGALGGAASRLRQKLGESLASVQQYDVPLPRATTSSLEALHAYALAFDEGRTVVRLSAIPHLKRAIELDPDFAMAHASLSGMYANTGQSALAPSHSRRAFELRDRVSERERYLIAWRYYRDATQEADKALELAREWTAAYPREAFAFNSLGIAAGSLGRYQQALDALREAVRLDQRLTVAASNLAGALFVLNRVDELKAFFANATAQQADYVGFRRFRYQLAFTEGDTVTMARELEATLAKPEGPWATNWRPRGAAFGGRIREAHRLFRESLQITTQAHFAEYAARYGVQDAESHAVVGQCADARAEIATALGLSRDNITLERAARVLAWCGFPAEAGTLSAELTARFPEATLIARLSLPLVEAATAIKAGDSARGLEILEPLRPLDLGANAEFWPNYLRGVAYLNLKQGPRAALEFQTLIEHRGESADSMLVPLAHLGLARAMAMSGDRQKAGEAYQAFLTFWKDADADLPSFVEARSEQARVRP